MQRGETVFNSVLPWPQSLASVNYRTNPRRGAEASASEQETDLRALGDNGAQIIVVARETLVARCLVEGQVDPELHCLGIARLDRLHRGKG